MLNFSKSCLVQNAAADTLLLLVLMKNKNLTTIHLIYFTHIYVDKQK